MSIHSKSENSDEILLLEAIYKTRQTKLKQGFAISAYHNMEEIYVKIDSLLAQPLRSVKQEKMKEYLDYFESKCAKSKTMTTETKMYIPGGVQHNLAFYNQFL